MTDIETAQSLMTAVTDDTFDAVVASSDLPVVFVIGAPWCIDCRRIAPFMAEFAKRRAGKARFLHADFDQNPGLKARFDVRHIPTLVFLEKGKAVGTLVEPKSVAPVKEFLEKALAE